METYYITVISNNIDALGRSFTEETYGAFASNLTWVVSSLFILYLIFWGFSFWQGRGESNLMAFVFRLVRVGVIYFLATGWGWAQNQVYLGATQIPVAISSVMLQNITVDGHGMSERSIERDLYDFYRISITASIRIVEQIREISSQPSPSANNQQGQVEIKDKPKTPYETKLNNMLQSMLIWISSVLFIGYAAFVIFFSKISLLALLSIAPIFIILMMFNGPSRFFWGWVTTTVQVMLAPIFLYVFLAFYIVSIRPVVLALRDSMNQGGIPMMKDAAPFVLVCFSGLFLLIQVIPLAGRIAASTRVWATANEGAIQQRLTAWGRGMQTLVSSNGRNGSSTAAAPQSSPPTSPSESIMRDLQEQNAALRRLGRNR
ncbi:type IV secretion system protein [Labrys portucalensis]|uniref:Type IV secretion system protein n=1 Tax=Labrys neptuniae TaxID=376174 RepID=A0ABV6ZQQ5_9HYPH